MSIEVKGKNCKLWIKEHEGKDGNKWNTYSIGVSRKDLNGSYVNAYQDVTFTRNAGLTSDIPNGTLFDFEGWMSVKTRKDRDGNSRNYPVITVNKANFQYDPQAAAESYQDSFEQLDSDIPF